MIGRTLGHYRIESKLGEGGMGVVYRAADTRLKRPVAIKVLHADAVADQQRKKRFVQEAQAASALNHPNIITIYDIDEADGVDFIAMEYVAGHTLDHRIGRQGLGLGEVLKYAVQIADALTKAHAAGIVHRDLKPANIMVSEDGLVKVLDFGLAKLTQSEESDELAATVSMKPDAPRTEEGVILGTVAYMSPEQAEAKKVDARSDIFSFGAILYEMLTGRRAFQGDSKISTLSAILHQEPKPIREVVDGVPPHLEWIVSHCLRKDPGRRFQGMADLKVALEEVKEDSDSGRLFASPRPRVSSSPRLLIASILCVVVVAAAGLVWWVRRSPPPAAGPALTRLTADSGLTTDPVLSPDGRLLAYASDRSGEGNLDIWVQQVVGGDPIRLTHDPADKSEPAFSSDGSKIAFRSEREGGGIYVSSALGGGEPRLLVRHGRRPRFSPDGSQIAYWVGASPWAGKIYVLPSTGGTPRQFQPDFSAAAYPVWSPDGKQVLFLGWLSSKGSVEEAVDWLIGPLDPGAAIQTRAYAAFRRQFRLLPRQIQDIPPGQWLADPDRVIFAADLDDHTNLWQVRLDSRTRTSQSLQQLTFGTGHDVQPSVASPRLVFSSQLKDQNIWLLPIQANQGKGSGEIRRATQGAAVNSFPSVSPDGRKLAYASRQSGRVSIWIDDLESGRRAALTASSYNEEYPMITPDGSKAAYGVTEGEKRPIYVAAIGGGSVERICEDCGSPWSWSSDGKRLFYYWIAFRRMGWIDLGSRQKTEFRQPAQSLLVGPRIAPDDRWIAFGVRNGPNRQQLAIAELRGGNMPAESEWIPVTDDTHWAVDPSWSPDGSILYFTYDRDGSRCIWAQRLDAGKRPIGPPVEVKHFHSAKSVLGNGLSLAHDKLVFSMGETTGNIWMTKLDASR